MPIRVAAVALAVLLTVGSAVACDPAGGDDAAPGTAAGPSGSPSPGPTPTASATPTITVTPIPIPPGIHLSFVQQRPDEGTGRSQVRVVNGTAHTIHVDTVAVDWAGYPARPNRVDYPVPARATVDLRYFLPPAVCTRQARVAPIRAVIRTARSRVERPVQAEGVRFLTRLWQAECDQRRVDAAVTLAYGRHWTRTGAGEDSVLHGSLVLHRRGGTGSVAVSQVQGSVLFELGLGPADQRVLAPGRPRAAVPLTISEGGRCDPHSLGQSTQTFLFRVWVRLDGGRQISRLLPPTKPQQAALLRFLHEACSGDS